MNAPRHEELCGTSELPTTAPHHACRLGSGFNRTLSHSALTAHPALLARAKERKGESEPGMVAVAVDDFLYGEDDGF